ncbi:MAG TPA: hypothetical protein PKC38_02755, partial [Chitinophagales bacterium]|nr:hypothetical protein [Chitinophagales bacterium]
WLNFTEDCVIRKASDIKSTMPALFKPFHRYLLEHGIYIGPSGYEVCFVSAAHTDEQLEQTADIIMQAITHTFQK